MAICLFEVTVFHHRDHFASSMCTRRETHIVNSLAPSLGIQICLQMGFNRDNPWLYLSGDNPELLDVYPELAYLRDIVYLLKAFMAPTSDALPEVCDPCFPEG